MFDSATGQPSPAIAAPGTGAPWHIAAAEDVLAQVDSSPSGLTPEQATARLSAHGPNELREAERISWLRILLAQFNSLMVWILIAAGIVSGVLGDAIDAIAILAIVVLNAAIGFHQEFSAEKSIAALKKMTAPLANVRREGQVTSIPASGVVVGDILVLEAGGLIAADGRILKASSLMCVESALTGESEGVTKNAGILDGADLPLGDRANMVFLGASVGAGAGEAVVVATGMNTELGRIAALIQDASKYGDTPLQKSLDSFGRVLVWVTLGIVALLFVLGLLRGTKPLELLMTSVSLAVAAVPEGLPAVVTVALSLGVLRMARRRALIRKLAAVETLGSTSVICTDKTGTLTVGQMTVRALSVAGHRYEVSGEGYGPEGDIRFEGGKADASHAEPLRKLATVLLACNHAHLVETDGVWETIGDPTEGALLVAGAKAGGNRERIERELPMQMEFPFDSDRKRSTVLRRSEDGQQHAYTNGAPGQVLERCVNIYTREGVRPLSTADRELILEETSTMAKQALRVLASAHRDLGNASPGEILADDVEKELTFIGLSGMQDPPRPEAKEAIARCHDAGIRVVMITGDHRDTAKAIAHELGIASNDAEAVSGTDLTKLSDEELRTRSSVLAVYARVTAEHKLRIVRAMKAGGAVVAMTGDGVNDAPAIKGAHIGIAMGIAGTEVTKQAADMIITDDNFATILIAVEEGRVIYANIRKTLQYLLAGNTGELLLMTLCVVVGLPTPLLPIHLLWINLVTDGLPALCLATDPIDPDLMKLPPRPRLERIANHSFLRTMLFTGSLTAGVALSVFYCVLRTETLEVARSYAFATLVFAEMLRAFGARSETKPVWRIPFFANTNLVLVVVLSFGIQVWSQHSPTLGRFLGTTSIPFLHSLLLLAIGAIPLLVLEAAKVLRNARQPIAASPHLPTKH